MKGETSPLIIEKGWWQELQREEIMCRECQSGRVEDAAHWLLECGVRCIEHQPPLQSMRHIVSDLTDPVIQLVLINANKGCQHLPVPKIIMRMRLSVPVKKQQPPFCSCWC